MNAINVPDDPGPFSELKRWKPYLHNLETAAVFAGPVLAHPDWPRTRNAWPSRPCSPALLGGPGCSEGDKRHRLPDKHADQG